MNAQRPFNQKTWKTSALLAKSNWKNSRMVRHHLRFAPDLRATACQKTLENASLIEVSELLKVGCHNF